MYRPALALLLSASAAVAAFGQDTAQKVTFTAPAQPAKKLLAKLSEVTGVSMQATGLTVGEILVVKVKDVPLKDLMDKIAESAGGQWRQDGTAFYLERSSGQELKDLAAERAAKIAAFKKSLAKIADRATGAFDRTAADKLAKETQAQTELEIENQNNRNTELWKKREVLQRQTPAMRLSGRVVGALDPAMLLDLPESGRYVFSTNPTRMQRPLGPAAYQAAQQYVSEQTLWAEAVRRLPYKPHEGYEEDNGLPVGFYGIDPPKYPVSKVLLIVTRMGREDMMSFDLMLVDAKGHIVSRNGFAAGSMDDESNRYEQFQKDSQPKPDDGKMVLSPLSQKIASAFERQMQEVQGMAETGPRLPADVVDILLHPEITDPLATFATDFVVSYADWKKTNLVANLPDSIAVMPMFLTEKQTVPIRAIKLFSEAYVNLSYIETPGWTIVRPQYPVSARKERTDRVALGEIVRAFAATQNPDIEQLADLAAKTDNPFSDELTAITLMMVADTTFMWEGANWDLLQFYGSFSRQQRAALRRGAKLQISQLSPAQRSALTHLIFYTQIGLNGGEQSFEEMGSTVDVATKPIEGDVVAIPGGQEAMYGDISMEPTEALPNGLLPGGVVSVQLDLKNVLAPAKGARWFSRGMGPEEIGSMMAMREHPEVGGDTSGYPDMSSLKLGSREELTIKVLLAPGVNYQDMLTSSKMGDKVYTLDQLPKEIREAIVKAKKDVEESMKGSDAIPPPTGAAAAHPRQSGSFCAARRRR